VPHPSTAVTATASATPCAASLKGSLLFMELVSSKLPASLYLA